MLKNFPHGVATAEWLIPSEYGERGERSERGKKPSDCESSKLFNYEEFLNKYSSGI